MQSRAQLILLSILTLILAAAVIGLGVYTFKNNQKTSINYLVKSLDNKKDDPKESKEKTAMELNKDKKSDNLTQQTLASLVDVIRSKNQNSELSDEELKKYLQDKIGQVDTFSYSFTKEDIKIAEDKNTKQDIENYLTEVYYAIPKQTIFAGTLDLGKLESLASEDLNKEFDRFIKTDQQAMNDLFKKNVPQDAVLIEETYLKLINLEIIFFKANQEMEIDPLKSKSIFNNIKNELPKLKQALDQELKRIVQEYNIELQITN